LHEPVITNQYSTVLYGAALRLAVLALLIAPCCSYAAAGSRAGRSGRASCRANQKWINTNQVIRKCSKQRNICFVLGHGQSQITAHVGSVWLYGLLRSPRCPLRFSWCLSRPPRCALRSSWCLCALRSLWCPSLFPRVSPGAPGASWVLQ
jgi:hypothetical protein